jgi:hypothetical protein
VHVELSTTADSELAGWPGLHEFEWDELSNTLKVALVIRHEHAAGLAAGQGEEDVVRERLRDARDFQSLLESHFRKKITGLLPSVCRRRNHPIGSLKDLDQMPFQRPAVLRTSDAGAQLLCDYHTEILKWRQCSMKLLESFVGGAIAKALDEELRIEDVLPTLQRHRSESEEVM